MVKTLFVSWDNRLSSMRLVLGCRPLPVYQLAFSCQFTWIDPGGQLACTARSSILFFAVEIS